MRVCKDMGVGKGEFACARIGASERIPDPPTDLWISLRSPSASTVRRFACTHACMRLYVHVNEWRKTVFVNVCLNVVVAVAARDFFGGWAILGTELADFPRELCMPCQQLLSRVDLC